MSETPRDRRSLPKKTIGIVALSLLAFWFIDIPWTVRAKVLIMKMLPLDAKTIDDMTLSLCMNVYGPNWETCYRTNKDEKYAKVASARHRVQALCDTFRMPNRKQDEVVCRPNDDLNSTKLEFCLYTGDKEWEIGTGKIKLMYVALYEDGCTMVFDDWKTTLSDCSGRSCPN